MRSKANSSRRVVAAAFAAVVFLSPGCGKDAYVGVTEERVPNPPVHLITKSPREETRPAPDMEIPEAVHPRIAEVPRLKEPDEVPELVPPRLPPRGSRAGATASFVAKVQIAGFHLFDVTSSFGSAEMIDCARFQPRGAELPTWLVHFEKTAAGKAPKKLRLIVTANPSPAIRLPPRSGSIEIDGAHAERGDTRRPLSFTLRGAGSRCSIRLQYDNEDEENLLSGTFRCEALSNADGFEVPATGSFSCKPRHVRNLPNLGN